jgi:hypothetical protein
MNLNPIARFMAVQLSEIILNKATNFDQLDAVRTDILDFWGEIEWHWKWWQEHGGEK